MKEILPILKDWTRRGTSDRKITFDATLTRQPNASVVCNDYIPIRSFNIPNTRALDCCPCPGGLRIWTLPGWCGKGEPVEHVRSPLS